MSSTAGPTPTQRDGPNRNSVSSPPLILAFLAIALFVGNVVILLTWKRIRMHNQEISQREREKGPGKRPKLWDLWAGEQARGIGRWEDVMVSLLWFRFRFVLLIASAGLWDVAARYGNWALRIAKGLRQIARGSPTDYGFHRAANVDST